MNGDRYVCLSCERVVDADNEPSPGEPRYCPDCHNDRLLHDGLRAWGLGGVA